MYKKDRFHQFGLSDFNQPFGLKMNPDNRWIKKSETIPWEEIEDKYAELFKSSTGMPAKPLRCALGSLLIQKQLGFSDRELVEEIRENPYLQYFIGLPGYVDSWPFVPSLLVEFRKRFTEEVLAEINEMIIRYNTPDKPDKPDGDSKVPEEKKPEEEAPNAGTMILDATCAPQNITFPQDINLLNEARENLEEMIDSLCFIYNTEKPRTYRNNARRDYLKLARCKKRTVKRIRLAIKQQLQYIRRDLKYLDGFLSGGMKLKPKQEERLEVIRKVYAQQEQMYRENTHSVPERIVSISQPYIRPIVRGKAAAPLEFGAKFDLSLTKRSYGLGCIRTKLADTTRCSIALSIMAMNIARLVSLLLCRFLKSIISRYEWCQNVFYKENLMTQLLMKNAKLLSIHYLDITKY